MTVVGPEPLTCSVGWVGRGDNNSQAGCGQDKDGELWQVDGAGGNNIPFFVTKLVQCACYLPCVVLHLLKGVLSACQIV